MSKNLLNTVYDILKKDDRLISQDWDLLKNKIQELAYNLDENLISLLLDDEVTRNKFFIDIKDIKVFDSNKFIRFVDNKQFLPDSYTSYKNKIGLINKNWEYLAESNEISLAWAYKDCILAWGQDEEDSKREEVFYNDILWSDEIDVLLSEKAFINFKRIDKGWEHKLESFNKNEDWDITDNLIIKWNNLLALHSLKSKFAWKVKLIYIDPPYNTQSDSFKYNDKFNHSTWLTFMKNRLEVAKDFLSNDGVIFVQCDDNEQAYLKVLMDEIFEVEKLVNVISVKMNESKWLKNAHIEKKMPKNKEYLLIYSKLKDWFTFNPEKVEKDNDELLGYVKYYNKYIPNIDKDISEWKIEKYPKWNDLTEKLKDKEVLIYMVTPDNDIKDNWAKKDTFFSITNSKWKVNIFYKDDKWKILKVLFLSENTSKFLWDLWTDISTININKESGVETLSNWQKPEKLLERIINLSTKEWDIVLDYHLWSWTTCAVAHKMKRKYIWVEQMDYIESISVERLKKVVNWEKWGITDKVNWLWGWEFVYMEMFEKNEAYISIIDDAKSTDDLIQVWEKIKKSAFINYSVNVSNIDNSIEDFKALSIEEQKAFLMDILDKNLLYLNYSEIEDKNNKVSNEDLKLNNNFYK